MRDFYQYPPTRVCRQKLRQGSIHYGPRVKKSTRKALKKTAGWVAGIAALVIAQWIIVHAVLPAEDRSTAPTRSLHAHGRTYVPVELAPGQAAPPGLTCFGPAESRICLVQVSSNAELRTQKELRAAAVAGAAAMSDLARSLRRVGEGAGVVSQTSSDSNDPWRLVLSLTLTGAVGALVGFGIGRRRSAWPARTL